MKKTEFVKELSKRTGFTKSECEKILETFREIVQDTLCNGENVFIKGFLTFEVKNRKSRRGYNPITGKHEQFESVKTVNCKVGKTLKNAVKDF